MIVGICEDSALQREQLADFVRSWARQANRSGDITPGSMTIHQYASAKKFFFNQTEDGPFDLLFLDIDFSGEASLEDESDQRMHSQEGLTIAKKVREQDSHAVIVFITSHADLALEGYKAQAYDFLVKPVSASDLNRVLDYTNKHIADNRAQFYLVTTSRETKRVLLNDIYFFQARLQWVELNGIQGSDTFRARFSDVIEELASRGFISPHRSYLVNLAHVHSITKSVLKLSNGSEIPLSRNRHTEVFNAWMAYFGKGPQGFGEHEELRS